MKLKFKLTKDQLEIFNHPAIMKFICCGRRWGKSIFAIILMLVFAFRRKKAVIWYVAKSYRQTEYAYDKCIKSGILQAGVKPKGLSPRYLDFPNGTRIVFISSGLSQEFLNTLRGDGLDLLVIEEGAFVSKDFVDRILKPMLMDKAGKMVVISTPKGKNWFWKAIEKGIAEEIIAKEKRSKGEKYTQKAMGWIFPTSTGVKFQSERGKALLQIFKDDTPSSVWREECECIPSDETDGMNFDKVLVDSLPESTKEESILSLFFDEIHALTYALVYRVKDGAVLHTERFKSNPIALEKLILKFAPSHIITDSKAGNKIYKMYAKNKVKINRYRCPFSHVRAMCTQMALDIHNGNVKIRKKDENIINALEVYKDDMKVRVWLRPFALACGYRDVMKVKADNKKKEIPSDIGKAMQAMRHGTKFKINPFLMFGKDYIK